MAVGMVFTVVESYKLMMEGSTVTRKSPWWKTLYESIVFWGLVAMIADMVAFFFGGSMLGPGWVLGSSITAYSRYMRDDDTGKQYRSSSKIWWVFCFLFIAIFVLKTVGAFLVGKGISAYATVGQCCISAICLALTVNRIRELPERPRAVGG